MPLYKVNNKLHYYAHVPKCGGRSVENYLKLRFGKLAFLDDKYYSIQKSTKWNNTSPQHIDIESFKRLFPSEWISSSFAIVRHPLTRIVSSYNYYLANLKVIPLYMTIDEWFDEYVGIVNKVTGHMDNHLRPQADLVPDDTTFFQIEKGLDPVEEFLDSVSGGAKFEGRIKHTHSTHELEGINRIAVSNEFRKKVNKFYQVDYKRFGYDINENVDARAYYYSRKNDSLPKQILEVRRLLKHRLKRRILSLTPKPDLF